ncbi:hypothetical protein NP493_1861g00013 [Ridgeia piscesae]|uniref:Uncharacterized protein n=1 Tax=Ridgeia piscesae TaxID=27915 RepID=A0AAD9N6U1_RIDPI|nr:hypothetical protein NP493_1861g00013 [Ridgeia piscesae]
MVDSWSIEELVSTYDFVATEGHHCVTGRFDVNCKKECHCSGATEDCQKKNGGCQTECAPHFQGSTCQGA